MANNHTGNMSVTVLGCPITKMGLDDFVSSAEQFISSKAPHYIAMMNVAKLVKMRSDKDLAQSILAADLIGADGVPLVWASRLLGTPLAGRVNGTDLMYKLLERGNQKGYRIFFFGATEEVLMRVLNKVRVEYPAVKIAGFHHGYFNPTEELAIAHDIGKSQADILFIAFGSPRKELWVKRYFHADESASHPRSRREFRRNGRGSSPGSPLDAEEWLGVVFQALTRTSENVATLSSY